MRKGTSETSGYVAEIGSSRTGNGRNGRDSAQQGTGGNGHTSTNLNRYTTSNSLYRWHTNAFHEALIEMLKSVSPKSILDAGCGEGYVADLMAQRERGARITAIDHDASAIKYAKNHFGRSAHFKVASIFELPFPDDTFDLVLCSEVLEHLQNPHAALRELIRVSRRHVLITVPREPVFKLLNDIGQALNLCPDPGHVQFWTKQEFQEYFAPHFGEIEFAWKHTYQLMLGTVHSRTNGHNGTSKHRSNGRT